MPDHQTARRLDGEPFPVRAARRITAQTLAAWCADRWHDDALTVVSELATNAITYGAPPVMLALRLLPADGAAGPRLQIDVSDASGSVPVVRPPGEGGGYGMLILKGYAQVSVHPRPGGKTVRALLT